MNKMGIVILILILTLFFTLIGVLILDSKVEVKLKEDVLDTQALLEEDYVSYGYTIDNPKIILNPYEISPLTALIIFETEKEIEPVVTIYGKEIDEKIDKDVTYSYKFKKDKVHYLPIYGLYANYTNKVLISDGENEYEYDIQTSDIAVLSTVKGKDLGNKLFFDEEDNYLYAYDKYGDIRWILNGNYKGNISMLDNGHIIVSTDRLIYDKLSTGIVEMDLLGKIYYEYNVESGYNYLNYVKEDNNILFSSRNSILEIDNQNGEVVKEHDGKWDYEINNIYSLYNNTNFEIKDATVFGTLGETKTSNKKIMILNYKKLSDKYDISFYKERDRLVIKHNFRNKDKVYVVLDKFMDKKVYKLDTDNNYFYINQDNLEEKYSIYLKINDKLYKTNKYVDF